MSPKRSAGKGAMDDRSGGVTSAIPTLVADRLVKHFGNFAAVEEVSLTVRAGEVVGVLGPNGAGKTTTLRMLAGILTPTSGEVRIAGVPMLQEPLQAKRRVGFLSGDTQLYRRLTPRELLIYFGRLYEVPQSSLEKKVADLIEQLDMGSFSERPCGALSSGQKQRANIARAFLHDPELLILDEPTATLDVWSGQFIVEAIRREKGRGKAILFSTHIMSEVEYLCDRIYLIHGGRIVESGTVPEILTRSGCSNLTDAFLQQARKTEATVVG